MDIFYFCLCECPKVIYCLLILVNIVPTVIENFTRPHFANHQLQLKLTHRNCMKLTELNPADYFKTCFILL